VDQYHFLCVFLEPGFIGAHIVTLVVNFDIVHLKFLPRYACMPQHPLLAFIVSKCEVLPGIEDLLRRLLVD
jgi:hypothetical protein